MNEEWIEEKAKDLHHELYGEQEEEDYIHGGEFLDMKDFIRQIVKDCKPKVNGEFVQKWRSSLGERYPHRVYINPITLIALLKEAGVEVED